MAAVIEVDASRAVVVASTQNCVIGAPVKAWRDLVEGKLRGRYDFSTWKQDTVSKTMDPLAEEMDLLAQIQELWGTPLVSGATMLPPLGCRHRSWTNLDDLPPPPGSGFRACYLPLNSRNELRSPPVPFGQVTDAESLEEFAMMCGRHQDTKGWPDILRGRMVLQLFGMCKHGFTYAFVPDAKWYERFADAIPSAQVRGIQVGENLEYRVSIWTPSFLLGSEEADACPGYAAVDRVLSHVSKTGWKRLPGVFKTLPEWREEGDEVVVVVEGEVASRMVLQMLSGIANNPAQFASILRSAAKSP